MYWPSNEETANDVFDALDAEEDFLLYNNLSSFFFATHARIQGSLFLTLDTSAFKFNQFELANLIFF